MGARHVGKEILAVILHAVMPVMNTRRDALGMHRIALKHVKTLANDQVQAKREDLLT